MPVYLIDSNAVRTGHCSHDCFMAKLTSKPSIIYTLIEYSYIMSTPVLLGTIDVCSRSATPFRCFRRR